MAETRAALTLSPLIISGSTPPSMDLPPASGQRLPHSVSRPSCSLSEWSSEQVRQESCGPETPTVQRFPSLGPFSGHGGQEGSSHWCHLSDTLYPESLDFSSSMPDPEGSVCSLPRIVPRSKVVDGASCCSPPLGFLPLLLGSGADDITGWDPWLSWVLAGLL